MHVRIVQDHKRETRASRRRSHGTGATIRYRPRLGIERDDAIVLGVENGWHSRGVVAKQTSYNCKPVNVHAEVRSQRNSSVRIKLFPVLIPAVEDKSWVIKHTLVWWGFTCIQYPLGMPWLNRVQGFKIPVFSGNVKSM